MARRRYVDTGYSVPAGGINGGPLDAAGYKYRPEAHKDAKLTDITIYIYHKPSDWGTMKRVEAYTYIYPEYQTRQGIVETYATGGEDLYFSETTEEPLGGLKETLGV